MADLETLLLAMTAHGKPAVSLTTSGWHCRVEMTVPHVGVGVTVTSEYRHVTPLEAAQTCMDRIRAVASNSPRVDHG